MMFKSNKNKITIIIDTSSSSLVSVKPSKFADTKLVSKEILKGNVLVVDINDMEKVEAIRFIDFLTGVLFATKGSFKKISNKTYLLAPSKELLAKFLIQFEEK